MSIGNLQQTMRDAMQSMRSGDLNRATELIQRGIASGAVPATQSAAPINASVPPIDGTWHVVRGDAESVVREPDIPTATSVELPTAESGTFNCAAGARDYVMHAPRERGLSSPPILLMLHGCTQDAANFARGTRMHEKATAAGFVVVFATQPAGANPNGCWNWFRPGDQQRDRGEPAILAGLAAEMRRRFQGGNDIESPVFVAGLSAGAAMAVTLGRRYPDLFRGVGVHSGLPHGCAHDVPSALGAMRRVGKETPHVDEPDANSHRVPTIVFHGDRDHTVNVRNADRVVADVLRLPSPQNAESGGDATIETSADGVAAGGHGYTTTTFRDPAGRVWAERWIIHGAGHAWFGGSRDGTYTDPKGPDATAEMLRFFRALI